MYPGVMKSRSKLGLENGFWSLLNVSFSRREHSEQAPGQPRPLSETVSQKTKQPEPGTVAHAFNPSIWEAEANESLRVPGQLGLYSEFQKSQGYKELSDPTL